MRRLLTSLLILTLLAPSWALAGACAMLDSQPVSEAPCHDAANKAPDPAPDCCDALMADCHCAAACGNLALNHLLPVAAAPLPAVAPVPQTPARQTDSHPPNLLRPPITAA